MKWIEIKSKFKIWDSKDLQDVRDSVVTMHPTDPSPRNVQNKAFCNFSDPVDHINQSSVCRNKQTLGLS